MNSFFMSVRSISFLCSWRFVCSYLTGLGIGKGILLCGMKILISLFASALGCIAGLDEKYVPEFDFVPEGDYSLFSHLSAEQIVELAELTREIRMRTESLKRFQDYGLVTKFESAPDIFSKVEQSDSELSKLIRTLIHLDFLENSTPAVKKFATEKLAKMVCPGDCWTINWNDGMCYVPDEVYMINCEDDKIQIAIDSCSFGKKNPGFPGERTGADMAKQQKAFWTTRR